MFASCSRAARSAAGKLNVYGRFSCLLPVSAKEAEMRGWTRGYTETMRFTSTLLGDAQKRAAEAEADARIHAQEYEKLTLHATEINVGDRIWVDGAWCVVTGKDDGDGVFANDPDLTVEGDDTLLAGTYPCCPAELTAVVREHRTTDGPHPAERALASVRAMIASYNDFAVKRDDQKATEILGHLLSRLDHFAEWHGVQLPQEAQHQREHGSGA